jgi:CPA2 family monovalent cation:H+ antiporter-2
MNLTLLAASGSAQPLVNLILAVAVVMVVIGLIIKKLKQPYIVGYVIAGAVLGKQGFGLISDMAIAKHLGEIGIILLLFFIGMEISLPQLVKRWKIAIVGTSLQIGASVLLMWGVGALFGWPFNRIVVLGFIIALSSSAIVIKLLEERKLIDSPLGQDVLSILLMQDIVIVPLLITCSLMGGSDIETVGILKMLAGGICLMLILAYIYVKQTIQLPLSEHFRSDHELQVFGAIAFCFGGALFALLFGLSPALGAFVGGMVMHSAQSTDWIHNTLHSFRVLFVSVFFLSVGLQIDFAFIAAHIASIAVTLVAVYLTNHVLNMIVLRLFNESWHDAFVGGALLAQIGELSFLLASAALALGIINDFSYQFAISLISLTLIASPFWITISCQIAGYWEPATNDLVAES